MNEALIAQVEELGLSQKEARVYVANLMLGSATVQKIADFAGIKRVTTYVILESLLNLGLASQTNKGKKTYFVAEEPTNLLRLVETKEAALKDQRQNFEDILPQLDSLKSLPSDSPNVRFYEGIEGVKSIVHSFVPHFSEQDSNTVYGISNLDDVFSFFPEFKKNLSNPDRLNAGLKSKYIYTYSGGAILESSDENTNRESVFVDLDKYPLKGDISVTDEYVVIMSLEGPSPLGITIQSRGLAKAMKVVFDLAWEGAKSSNTQS